MSHSSLEKSKNPFFRSSRRSGLSVSGHCGDRRAVPAKSGAAAQKRDTPGLAVPGRNDGGVTKRKQKKGSWLFAVRKADDRARDVRDE
jgi:hypothetical protein